MLFASDDDDLDFTLLPGSSKLASLFASPGNSNAENSALTYTPPRQPASKTNDNQNAVAMSLLHATAVHAFKFENGKHVSQGKLGMAVVGHHDSSLYKLILYKGKQQQVTVATINQHFPFAVQPKCYANFSDESRANWSVMFETEQSLVDMAKQVALAKANSAGSSLNTVITQDMSLGDGQGLEKGSYAVLKYTGWLLTDHGFGKVFDSNADSDQLLKVKLGRGKLIKGWEEGLVGAKRHARRLLIVPPSLGYGSQGYGNAVPPDSTLIFEVCVTKLKQSQDNTRSSTPVLSAGGDGDSSDIRRPETRSLSQSTDDSIRARGESLSEQLTLATSSAESEKARIISRMAKMGTPMLPLKGAVPAQPSSESENEDEQLQRVATTSPPPQAPLRAESPKPPVKPRNVHVTHVPQPAPLPVAAPYQGIPGTQQMAVFQTQPQFPGSMASYGYQPMMLAPQLGTVGPSVADSQMPVLLSEVRSQSTEVRHNLGKISDKVDVVLSRLDSLRPQSSLPAVGSYMDGEMLLSNIQRIVQENMKLKEESQEKTNKIQVLNDKIYELLQHSERFMEKSHSMLEQRSDSLQSSAAQSQAQLLSLEKEKLEAMSKLNEALSQVASLGAELEEKQRRNAQMQEQLNTAIADSQKNLTELKELRSCSQERELLLSGLQNSLMDAERQKREVEMKLLKFECQVSDLEGTKHALEKVEGEIRKEWEIKCEKRVAEKEQDFHRQLQLLEEEKRTLQEQLREIGSKFEKATSEESSNQLLNELRKEVGDLKVWKAKYEQLSSSMESLKRTYDEQIGDLVKENTCLRSTCASPVAGQGAGFNFEAELKKIMNTLFRLLQKEFDGGTTYSKSEVVQIILDVIREYTTQVIAVKRSQTPRVASSVGRAADPASASSTNVPQATKAEKTANAATAQEPKQLPADVAEKLIDKQTDKGATEQQQAGVPTGAPSESQAETAEQNTSESTVPASDQQVSVTVQPRAADTVASQVLEQEKVEEGNAAQRTNASSEGQVLSAGRESKSAAELKEGTKKQEPDWEQTKVDELSEDKNKRYVYFDTKTKSWKPQPPPPPLFDDDDEDEEDWLK